MLNAARRSSVKRAEHLIRAEYINRLKRVPGRPITLINFHDTATPSLRFRYITEYVLRPGVFQYDPATQVGCTSCRPDMGRNIGCEYTQKCDCLEYAAVAESRLDDEQKRELAIIQAQGGSTMGFPKKFPYFSSDAKPERIGCLVRFYLQSRRAIYECNDNCGCGIRCRNKLVQFGRTVELEIFRTGDARGWGLRCKQNLHEGAFIDTYRGEVITDAEGNSIDTKYVALLTFQSHAP
jgi:histone-lysine N-methyltransferase SUV39H